MISLRWEPLGAINTSVKHCKQWLASVTAAREMANERQAREDQSMVALHWLMRDWLDGQQRAQS
jgi:hypothetical protein